MTMVGSEGCSVQNRGASTCNGGRESGAPWVKGLKCLLPKVKALWWRRQHKNIYTSETKIILQKQRFRSCYCLWSSADIFLNVICFPFSVQTLRTRQSEYVCSDPTEITLPIVNINATFIHILFFLSKILGKSSLSG